jgi:hypothetical protein
MADPTITNVDVGQIAIAVSDFEHHVWTAGGADELVAGTIVARLTSTGKWGIYAPAGTLGLEIARGVLTYNAVATGAGDVPVSVLVRGTVNQDRLIIDADGDGSNVDEAVIDDLNDHGILAKPVLQIAQLDNQ